MESKDQMGNEQISREQKRRIGAALFLEANAPFSEMGTEEDVDDAVLIRYADGTLRGRERDTIAAACRANVATAMIVAEFVQEYAEIRHLAWDWLGWKGAVLSATDRLSPETARAWDQHLARDPRSVQRTETARRLLGGAARAESTPPVRRRLPVLRLAANAMTLLIFFGIGYQVRNISQGPARPPVVSPSPPMGETQPKGVGVGGGTDLPGPEEIEKRTTANDTNNLEELGYRIEDLEAVRDKYPQVTAYPELLLPMYRKCATLEQDPAKRRAWNLKAQAAIQFIQSHSRISS